MVWMASWRSGGDPGEYILEKGSCHIVNQLGHRTASFTYKISVGLFHLGFLLV
jgi:hypothetical protein